jgi:hypothetical protein
MGVRRNAPVWFGSNSSWRSFYGLTFMGKIISKNWRVLKDLWTAIVTTSKGDFPIVNMMRMRLVWFKYALLLILLMTVFNYFFDRVP